MNAIIGLILSALFLGSIGAWADPSDWAEKGNGGDVVYCADRLPAKISMLDAYEAEFRYGFVLDFPRFLDSPFVLIGIPGYVDDEEVFAYSLRIAEALLNRLSARDPERAERYLTWLKSFRSESMFVHGDSLNIHDSGEVWISGNCSVRQLVIQRPVKSLQVRRYAIVYDYWKWMQPEQQAVAILHELIYRDVLAKNPQIKTSERVRFFNALILAGEMNRLSSDDYQELLQRSGLK